MKQIFSYIYFFLIIISLSSCRTTKPVTSYAGSVQSTEDYINSYKDIAVLEMKRTGIPASITLAQGMIESDYGRSRLAREGNNHFGIKCHSDWTGPTIRHNDDKRNECFRKYSKVQESYYDHSDFLKSGSRYKSLFYLKADDYKGWARGLQKAGYATNPDYANMLIRKIEEYNLMMYDKGYKPSAIPANPVTVVSKKATEPDSSLIQNQDPVKISGQVSLSLPVRVKENNRIQYIIVKDGDSRESLEKEFSLLRWELPKYNELKEDFQPVPGQLLYLQPKRTKAEPGKENYMTVEGETMYLISQKFGIKLKSLYELNRMEEGTEPGTGKKLWLRTIKPVN
jgi:flagellum-specific peptidoglycan hydrolase FlgJ